MTMSRVDIVKQFGINSNDNGGSSESQIAILTKEIKEFKKHSDQHPKDNSSNRGLLRKVALRKKLLTYLKRTNLDSYMSILQKLGLRQ
ncbi:MAG: 30S ribosomal protein S15 [Alphaproteobacteria bacterium]|nr:30S ribosomal protein S15 [Alphaproteobacteria bacterium]MBL0717835.1 30S ribosomal protein S15 [Alphaproteobacteria bacterium]